MSLNVSVTKLDREGEGPVPAGGTLTLTHSLSSHGLPKAKIWEDEMQETLYFPVPAQGLDPRPPDYKSGALPMS